MSIRQKLSLLLLAITLLFAGLIFVYVRHERDRLSSIFKNSYQERATVFEETISLLSSSLERLVLAETYWDELALFARADPGAVLPIKNIDVYLKENNIESLWIYGQDGALRYSHNRLNASDLAELALSREELERLFEQTKTCRFFIRSSQGFLEVYGATIHFSDDSERKMPPSGYLFFGKLYDQDYLEGIESISRCQVAILEPGAQNASMMVPVFSGHRMQFMYTLASWSGQPIGLLQGTVDSIFMKSLNRVSSHLFFMLFVFISSILVVSIIFLKRWVINPLHLVFKTLSTNNGAYVHSLLTHQDDFGDMARLVNRSFIQKEALVAEMANRAKLEAEISLTHRRFLELIDTIFAGIVLCRWRDDLQDFIVIEFNKMAAQAAGGTREEFLGRSVRDVFRPLEDSTFFEAIKQVYSTGKFQKCFKGVGAGGFLAQYQEIYIHKISDNEIAIIGSHQPT